MAGDAGLREVNSYNLLICGGLGRHFGAAAERDPALPPRRMSLLPESPYGWLGILGDPRRCDGALASVVWPLPQRCGDWRSPVWALAAGLRPPHGKARRCERTSRTSVVPVEDLRAVGHGGATVCIQGAR